MSRNKKSIITGLLTLLLIFSFNFSALAAIKNSTKVKMKQSYSSSLNYLINKLKTNGIQDWDVVALAMAGYNLNSNNLKVKGKTYLEAKQNDILKELSYNWTTSYAKHILTIASSGYDPSNFNGINLVDILKNSQLENGKFKDSIDSTTEQYLNSHIWSIIALESINENYNRKKAVEFLESNQNKDGGFSWLIGKKNSDIDTTAMAVTALTMAGRTKSSNSVAKALYFLKNKIKNLPKESQTSETLSWVIQAAVSAKDDISKYYVGKRNILEELYLYKDKTGGFKHLKNGKVDLIATNQVIRALVSFINNKNMYANIRYKKGNYFKALSKNNVENVILYSVYSKDLKNAELIIRDNDAFDATLLINGDKSAYSLKAKDGFIKFNENIDLKSLNYKIIFMKNGQTEKIILGSFEPVDKTYSVKVRIEGPDKTLGTYNVNVGNKTVYDLNGKPYTTEAPSAYAAVAKALIDNNIPFEADYSWGAPFITSIGDYKTDFNTGKGWMYWVNSVSPTVGVSDCELNNNDEILFYFIDDGNWTIKPLVVQLPSQITVGNTFNLKVLSEGTSVEGATVFVGNNTFTTNKDGIVEVKLDNAGKYEIYAEKNKDRKPEYIRSEKLIVEVK